jgi:uncharacterized protein YjbI with pentapeptide repeats
MGPAVAGVVVVVAGVATAAGWVDWLVLGRWLQPHVGLVVVFGMGGVLLATAVTRAALGARPRRQGAPRGLSWWVVAAAGVVVAGVVWGATAWLLGEADQAKDPAAARVEAIKTGLGIGAGTGGVFALLLAVRRQWHQELSAVSTEHDAGERRVTELYTKAVEQLGSAQAAVRLGGLYALERVAQNNPEQRQTVVNVLCAYLRMPFTPPSTSPRRLGIRRPPRSQQARRDPIRSPATSAGTAREELEVRLAAQRILSKHLQPGPEPKTPVDTFWEDIDLDLTGATLVKCDLSDCHVDAAFDGAQFVGGAVFDGARFANVASFDGARFDGLASFGEVQFPGLASFGEARFDGLALFEGARFTDSAVFRGARFTDRAVFHGARFAGPPGFSGARFANTAEFRDAQFVGHAGFHETQFANTAEFTRTQFTDGATFYKARFAGEVDFSDAWFKLGMPREIAALQHATPASDNAGDSSKPAT